MTQDDIIALAMEASGAEINGYSYGKNSREPIYGVPVETEDGFEYQRFDPPSWLSAFAALVAAAEREACAKVCDGFASCEGIAQKCADAIRARSTQ